MIDFIVNYWWLFIVAIAIIVVAVYTIYSFVKKPTSEQMKQVQEWLLYAVAKAEKELGEGTGEIKLRYVYDMFVERFPSLVKIISFETFSTLVDDVLKNFEELLKENDFISAYVKPID